MRTADRLKHPVALLSEAAGATAKQTLVEERAERVEIRVANSFRGLERAPAAKDAQAGEQPLLLLLEQIVRPRDRRPQRGVPLVGVPGALQYIEAVTEPFEELLRCQQLRPCRRELESEREAIQALAEFRDCFRCADFGPHRLRSLAEQRHRLVADERRKVEFSLALDAQRLAARDDEAQGRNGCHELGEGTGSPWEKVLDVVDHGVGSSVAHTGGERGSVGRTCSETFCNRRQDEFRVAQCRERHEDGSAFRLFGEQTCELDHEAGLARSSRAEDGQQTRVALIHE